MKKMHGTLVLGLCLALLFCYASGAKAEEDWGLLGATAVVRLDFRINIPTILYLQVGTAGALVDRVSFTVADIPGTGPVTGTSSGPNPCPSGWQRSWVRLQRPR